MSRNRTTIQLVLRHHLPLGSDGDNDKTDIIISSEPHPSLLLIQVGFCASLLRLNRSNFLSFAPISFDCNDRPTNTKVHYVS